MINRPVTGQTAARAEPDGINSVLETPVHSERSAGKQKMVAVLLNPGCEHDWYKMADDLQTLASEGKTIWQCRTCAKVTNTYDWQTP